MKCSEVSGWLIEAAEGALEGGDENAVRAHLEGCPECRAELARLRRGLEGVRAAMPALAPPERYLTPARLERVMSLDGPRIFQLATYRQFVAAAAAAAILVSGAFIAARLLGVRDARRLLDAPALAVQAEPPVRYVPVMVAAPGQVQPINVAHSVPAAAPALRPYPAQAALRTDTPGITVPVNHAFYDPEESSHWW